MTGVILGDCGQKMGNDGIDNGFIIFNNVRVPRANLLNKFSNITREGVFETTIKSADQRFAVQLGSLSQGRLMIAACSHMTLGHGLKIALRFAAMRKQFAKPDHVEEESLIEYPLHQFRLFPLLASTFAFITASHLLFDMWDDAQSELFSPGSHKMAELHAAISAMKAVTTWETNKGLQECREACGGLGYSHYAKIGILRNNFNINTTWEGDNNVLLQQTSKYLIDLV
jgi:acyl-CoA oxidase